jgi:peptidoglycan/xylan/chitin deacetylase (PgdA/CDA1 family)
MLGFQRDFIGYGNKPPKVKWPQGRSLALQIVVNYEAGGERSILHGDEGPEMYGEWVNLSPPKRDMAMESLFEYETRVAIWRLLELFDRHGVKVTFFATAKTLESNPAAARAIVERGHEICSHGYRWIEHYTMTREEERESIRKGIALIEKITGQRPLGWYCREPSPHTIELIAEEGGFLYDSDVYNDDLPYYANVHGKRLLLIPYTPDANDYNYLSNRFGNADEFYQYLRDSLDYLRGESMRNGRMMSVGIHVRISGRPGRTVAVDRFLQYAKQFEDVWITRRIDIAKWWLENYPPPA